MAEVTLSSKNQVVIPREARNALGLKTGDRLLAVVRGDRLIVLKKPQRYHKAIRGLTGRLYPEGFIEKERSGWD
jgi:AbrB family looped-hinge helix DNA binding protein